MFISLARAPEFGEGGVIGYIVAAGTPGFPVATMLEGNAGRMHVRTGLGLAEVCKVLPELSRGRGSRLERFG